MMDMMMRFSKLAVMVLLLFPVSVDAQRNSALELQKAEQAFETAPAPWLQQDPASKVYTDGREALNARRYQEAADAYSSIRRDYPSSGYVADSYYYQAFALYRLGSRSQLREARGLLETQTTEYPTANTLSDSKELMIRLDSQLASQGDAAAAASIAQQVADPCGPDQEVRVAALQALLNMNSEKAIPILKQVLEDKDACSAELRQQAVFMIGHHMGDESVDILLDLAHRNPDPDPEVVEQAVFWLSRVESEEALSALEEILRETSDPDIQEAALFSISQQGTEQSNQVLIRYAERTDISSELRGNAIFWVSQGPGGSGYVRSIWDGLDDPELKATVLQSVAQGGAEEDRRWLVGLAMDPNEDVEVRQNALFWAGQSGAFTMAELRELFSSFSDPEMKEHVVFVTSQRSDKEAVDFLMEIAEDKENGELREQAIFWLGQSDDPRVAEFLLRIIGQ